MSGDEIADRVREATKTELSRLGSSKILYAQTRGDLEPETVRSAVADWTAHVAETFEGWAAVESADTAQVFADANARERDHYEEIVSSLDGHQPGAPPTLVSYLRELETPIERAGGLLAWALVGDRLVGQVTGYFTGQADPTTASTFREMRSDYEDFEAAAMGLLEDLCTNEAEWERAGEAAIGAIEAAYDEYVETLESMGVNPKPVC